MIFESSEIYQNPSHKYTKSDNSSFKNQSKTTSEKQAKQTYFVGRFWLHFGDNFGPKNIKKGFKNRSLARGVSGGAPGLIFDRFVINCWRCFDVFWSCFSRILKKLRDVPFVVSVCSFAFFWLCVCVVSCRVVSGVPNMRIY